MGIFFDIINFAASSIFWGLLMAIAMMALFVFIVRGWWKDALFTVWTYIAGTVLAILLFFQCTLLAGAIKIRISCDKYEQILATLINQRYDPYDIINRNESSALFMEFAEEYPLVKNYIGAIVDKENGINGSGYIWTEGYSAAETPKAIVHYLKECIDPFILRRILWSLGFALVLGFIAIKTMETSTNSRLKARSEARISRGTKPITRDTKRISRRR